MFLTLQLRGLIPTLGSSHLRCWGPRTPSWLYIGRTDTEAEAPILWPPDAKCRLIGKDPDAGKDWRWEEKGMTEDEMVGWHHQLNVHEFEQTSRHSEEHWSLMCCSPWGFKELDTCERLNNNNKESRKMVLMKLFAWHEQRHKYRPLMDLFTW